MTDDLVAFLRERYDDIRQQEHQKRRSIPSVFDGHAVEVRWARGEEEILIDGRPYPAAKFWAIATEEAPDLKVIADLDSKLAIVAEYEQAKAFYDAHTTAPAGEAHGLLTALSLLALPHADHPDYREEWRA